VTTLNLHSSILRHRLNWRPLLVLLLFLLGQSGLWLHQQDSAQHADDSQCQICLHANSTTPGPVNAAFALLRHDVQKILLPQHDEQRHVITTARFYPTRAPPYFC